MNKCCPNSRVISIEKLEHTRQFVKAYKFAEILLSMLFILLLKTPISIERYGRGNVIENLQSSREHVIISRALGDSLKVLVSTSATTHALLVLPNKVNSNWERISLILVLQSLRKYGKLNSNKSTL